MPKPSKVINSLILIAIVIIIGMLGFSLIEGWPPLDALYMTIITISTIGYGETHELSDAGRIFNIVLIVMSISVVAYGISNIIGYVVEGKLNSYFKVRRMEKLLSGLRDHYIICGAGRTGHAILEEYSKADVPFVVIDKNPEIIEELGSKDFPSIRGDSAQDAILKKAGIDLAKGVIAVHATDSENLFTVLSCRQLRPDIYIVARVMDAVNEEKLVKCGANITISTSEIGGHRMASIALNPSINSFLDVVQKQSNDFSASVVEVSIESRSNLVGYSQRSADIRRRVGVTVLGILRDGENIFNPGPDECFREDDKVLIFGTCEQITRFKETFLREGTPDRKKGISWSALFKRSGNGDEKSKNADSQAKETHADMTNNDEKAGPEKNETAETDVSSPWKKWTVSPGALRFIRKRLKNLRDEDSSQETHPPERLADPAVAASELAAAEAGATNMDAFVPLQQIQPDAKPDEKKTAAPATVNKDFSRTVAGEGRKNYNAGSVKKPASESVKKEAPVSTAKKVSSKPVQGGAPNRPSPKKEPPKANK